MGAPTMERILVPCRCALGIGSSAQQDSRFYHGVGLPLSNRDGREYSSLGQSDLARARLLALPVSPVREPVGARCLQAAGRPARSARAQPVSWGQVWSSETPYEPRHRHLEHPWAGAEAAGPRGAGDFAADGALD